MIANAIVNKALTLLGYTDRERFAAPALVAVNTVSAEMYYDSGREGFAEISNLSENIRLSDRECTVIMPYGVAAYLARHAGDSNNQAYFAALYNMRRRPAPAGNIQDVLPVPVE